MGAISTKLLTAQNEEVTIPNAVLVESTIKNYSRQFGGHSALLSTKITIGYDTPWRQVQAMLLIAASQTDGLLASPKPYVVQRALSDFYVEYELFALTNRPRDRLSILTTLHSKVQDIFNEHGVQIMSPQYYEQPPQALIVPKEKWFTAPAATDEDRRCTEAEIFQSVAAGAQRTLQQMPRMGAADRDASDIRIAR
jgi:small-conductance mechanosensitive channel